VLISRRKEGETVLIGDEIELRIVSVRKKKVILGIIAPRDVKIVATKLSAAEMANTMAAANSVNLDQFLHAPSGEAEAVLFLLEGSKDIGNDR
jgi:carbon storage regulator